jgi:protein-tyrosine phosphatase
LKNNNIPELLRPDLPVLDFLFKRKATASSVTSLTADLHSHLLPALDDGAVNEEETLTLARGLQSLGYRKCITTPHIYQGVHHNTPETILPVLEKVKALLRKHQINFEMEAAAEYFFDAAFFSMIEDRSLMTFAGKYVLFELPFSNQPPMLDDVIFKMNLASYQPVLAHPERYSFFHGRHMKEYERLKNAEVLFQLNLMSLTGQYGEGARQAARHLIAGGMIEFAGTDLHREKQLPVLEAAKKTREYSMLLESGKLMNAIL